VYDVLKQPTPELRKDTQRSQAELLQQNFRESYEKKIDINEKHNVRRPLDPMCGNRETGSVADF